MIARTYPVSYEIDRPRAYNRWTVAFRVILAIPQLILVGGGGFFWFFAGPNQDNQATQTLDRLFGGGVLTAVLGILVFLAWFAILFTGHFPRSFRNFCLLIFRWGQNVHAYMTLQAAPYPPFGDGPYPLRLEVIPAEHYNRLTVLFRLILVIPHVIMLCFLEIAQAIVTVVAWFAILFTGQYPETLFPFSVGVSRWAARVMAYMYLFVDDYPPFSLASEPGSANVQAQARA